MGTISGSLESLSRVNCITAPNTMVGGVTHVVIFSILS